MKLVQAAVVVRWVAILAGVVTVAACSRDKGRTSGTTSVASPTRAELLAEALKYTYGTERAAVTEESPRITAPGGTLPRITIASATRTDTTAGAPGSRVIARLTSKGGGYARLGIAPGDNYVWRDSLGGGTEPARTLIIPADTTYPMFWLQHDADHTPLVAGATALPRLVISTLGYGMCDNGCGQGHCVMLQTRGSYDASSDSTRIR